jgi:hypothetical protein
MDRMTRVLVVANETVAGKELRAEIVRRVREDGAEILVVCPALNSRVRHWLSDDDRARAEAADRLDSSLRALAAEGVAASGYVGDSDPLQALDDALRRSGQTRIVSTHPPGSSNWLERDVVSRARARHGLPIGHVVVDLGRRPALRAA